jgi:NAD dependent epimerase/dehydratase
LSKKVVVTGADGFIGSHLVEELLIQGYDVRAFCLYNSWGHKGWLDSLPNNIYKEIDFCLGDVRDYDSVAKGIKGCSIIFHLASLIAIPYSYIAPESYIDTNIKGTHNVLRACLKNNVDQLLHTSTSEVYGTAQYVPIDETHPLVGQSPYSASKIAADQLAYSYYSSFGVPVSIVRPFNTFGPRQSTRAIIPTIISQLIAGVQTLKLGNIEATRDFNYVKDTVKGMLSFIGNVKTFGQVINIGTGVEISIKEVVKIISLIIGRDCEIQVEAQRLRPEKSEVERLCASNKKAKEILNWSPEYDLHKGLQLTIDWFKENGSVYKSGYSI